MPPETLIDGFTFLVTTDAESLGSEGGLYHRDTRYLSGLTIEVQDADVAPVGETIHKSNEQTRTLATAGPIVNEINEQNVAKHTNLVVTRNQSVHENAGYAETLSVANYRSRDRPIEIHVGFETDFADLFEVRGLRSGIERDIEATVGDQQVEMSYGYETTDGSPVERQTTIRFGIPPEQLTSTKATFLTEVDANDTVEIPFTVAIAERRGDESRPGEQVGLSQDPRPSLPTRAPPIDLPTVEVGGVYESVFERARTDLTALTTQTDQGPVALAGTPWFATPFGRDAILTAHQTLAVAPELAEGTLRYFAAHQGSRRDASREEMPGKIFHEIRHGELADRELVPHTPYFGTADATALWVTLLAETCRWRGEDSLAVELAQSLVDALDWLMRASESTAEDPFIYYSTESGVLDHKAWKDTADSVRFADGEIADGPLAIAEVQGYAASALSRGAAILDRIPASPELDCERTVDHYHQRAESIETAFDQEFWLPERSFYALAKDGRGRIVDAVTSNIGHCLWTEIIPDHRVESVVETLVDGPLNSGWGLRTMSPNDAGYSPVSYHAGGVWPHDTSLAALGLARYGQGAAAEKLGGAVLDAAKHFTHCRLPELYCGFGSDRDPVEYPAACTPQAWAAGAPFAVLRAAFRPAPTDEGVQPQRASSLFPETVGAVFEQVWADESSRMP